MLTFEKLTVTNFGPFKGTQEINFGQQDGVTIIWGDNGRGKTTLLNIFRYALFGKIKTRHGSDVDYISLSNIEEKQEGKYGFKVVLKMRNDQDRYTLTRDVHLRDGVRVPKSNADFMPDFFLKKNSSLLAPPDRDHELSVILPEDISRFFLFDGELLQEYESLIDDTSDDGRVIKESIEKILGMPILTNGSSDIKALVSDYITAKNRAAQNDKNTADYARSVSVLLDQIAGHNTEKKRLSALLADEEERFKIIKQEMSDTEKLRGLLSDVDSEQKIADSLKAQQESLRTEIQGYMKSAWQILIAPTISSLISDTTQKVKTFSHKSTAAKATESVIQQIERTINNQECEVCGQHISPDILSILQSKLLELKGEAPQLSAEDSQHLQQLQVLLAELQGLNLNSDSTLIHSKITDLRRVSISLSDKEQRIHDLKQQIATFVDYDKDDIGLQLTKRYATSEAKIKELRAGIEAEQKKLNDAVDRRNKLDAKITQLSQNKDVQAASKRLDLVQKIESIFTLGIEQYRSRLKQNVEADASALFNLMSADTDYDRLKINDSYGLEIIHKDGITVPSRSAGFEHIVALSLIGALHKNAPLQGPVIMDSPFGRLGSQHETNVARNLPSLSGQVIVLVHDRELDPDKTRELLGGYLLHEYHLARISSFHTEIR